jgi:hypothetical protein
MIDWIFDNWAFFSLVWAIIGVYAYAEFLRGRIDHQTEIMAAMSQAIRRLEQELHRK